MIFLLDKKYALFISFLKKTSLLFAFLSCAIVFAKNFYSSDWLASRESTYYNAPMLFLFFWWIKYRLEDTKAYPWKMVGIDLIMLGLVSVRLVEISYHSGHVLFLVYTFLTTKDKTYHILCSLMLLLTCYFKFVLWGDFITPPLGLLLALVLYFIRRKVQQ